MAITTAIAIGLTSFAILFLTGNGDNWILGLTRKSKSSERKPRYLIKRLRAIIEVLLLALSLLCLFLRYNEIVVFVIAIVLCIIAVILANTWAKNE